MDAGLEMDAKVAEAMGHVLSGRKNMAGVPSEPAFSTSIADAWEVVGWMREHLDAYSAITVHTGRTNPGAVVTFQARGQDAVIAEADTAPLAICRAFLAHVDAVAPSAAPDAMRPPR